MFSHQPYRDASQSLFLFMWGIKWHVFHSSSIHFVALNSGLALAHSTFEDAYLAIAETDGAEWADALRYKMHDNSAEPIPAGERSWLLT